MRQPRKRVTVYIDEDVHMELKIKAARTGATVSDWVNDMLTEALEARAQPQKPDTAFEEMLEALRQAGKQSGPNS
jgi:plasmid stability protein